MHQIFPAVVDYDITDHYPVMALVNNKSIHKNVQPKFAESFAKINRDSFKNNLQKRIPVSSFMSKIFSISEHNVDKIFSGSTCW